MRFLYFTTQYAIKTHDKILEISGGKSGIKNVGNIDSPLYHIQNDEYYPTFEEKLNHLVFCINKFHAFNDGNKRTSIAMGTFFLIINGLDTKNILNKFVIEMENIAVAVADNLIDKDMLFEIIYSIINENEYSENLKLKIINALNSIIPSDEIKELNDGLSFYLNVL
jgi:death-on-curing protein